MYGNDCNKTYKIHTTRAGQEHDTQKEVWRIHANNTIKHDELLETSLESIYAIVQSICNHVLNYQVYNSEEYVDIDNKQDTLQLLGCIKNLLLKWKL